MMKGPYNPAPFELDIRKESPSVPEPRPHLGVVQGFTPHPLQIRGLNKKLIARIGHYYENENDKFGNSTNCLLEDAEFALENQYSSPFESANPEGRLPSLMGMIQSGMVTPTISTLVGAVDGIMPAIVQKTGETIQDNAPQMVQEKINDIKRVATDQLNEWGNRIDGLQGRTSFTKINSQQIYTSSSAVRITGTLVLVAWADAKSEVEHKLQFLQTLATPAHLHNQSILQSFATQQDKLHALFPSFVPPAVFLQYGGKLYAPLFIESLSAPITAPMNADGSRIAVKAQITLVSKQAWDKKDIVNLYAGA